MESIIAIQEEPDKQFEGNANGNEACPDTSAPEHSHRQFRQVNQDGTLPLHPGDGQESPDPYILQQRGSAPDSLLLTVHALSERLLESYRQEIEILRKSLAELKQTHSWVMLKNEWLSSALERFDSSGMTDGAHAMEIREECSKAITELAGAISHELNQPLTVIIGRIQLMKRGGCDASMLIPALSIIEEQARRMADIVRKIGSIQEYATKPYTNEHSIVDIDKASHESEHPGGAHPEM